MLLHCNTPPVIYPFSEIVIPGIISFTKGSHRSKSDGQEKILKITCSPVGQLLESVCFFLIIQKTRESVNVMGGRICRGERV